MKTLLTPLLLILTTLFFVTNANAKWTKLALFSNNKTEIYVEKPERYEGRKVYLWTLQNHINGYTNNDFRSAVLYQELDCSARRYRNLSMKFYRANMGEGKPEFDDSITSDWSYPRPDEISIGAGLTTIYCGVSDMLLKKEGRIK